MLTNMFGKITYVGKKKMIMEVNWKSYWVMIRENHKFVASDKPCRIYCREIIQIVNNEIKSEIYGFETLKEYEWFNNLLNCHKIGPKTAIKIMQHDISLIQQLIVEQNFTKIANLPGLNRTIANSLINYDWKPWSLSQNNSHQDKNETSFYYDNVSEENICKEVADTLKLLGYEDQIINEIIKDLKPEKNQDISDLISIAIKTIANKYENSINETQNV